MREYLIILLIGMCCGSFFAGRTEADEFAPWNFDQPVAVKQKAGVSRDLTVPAVVIYQGSVFFSRYISPVDGNRCDMYPTCSAYSRQAVAKHGFLIGIVMIADRLIHENNEMDTAPLIETGDSYRYRDPVENNDFWWGGRLQ